MKRKDMEALIAAADELAEAVDGWDKCNRIDLLEDVIRNLDAALTAYRAARDAARPVPPSFATSA